MASNSVFNASAVLLLAVLSFRQPVQAASTARLQVNSKGVLQIPLATLKQLGVKPDREGSVWIEFPRPHSPKPKVRIPQAIKRPQPQEPIRILTPITKGSAQLGRTRIDNWYVPGAPGTVYFASGSGNIVMLKKP